MLPTYSTGLRQPTVGIDFLAKNLQHKNRNFRLQLWDTAGQERFRSLIPSYLKDAISALIVYDVTSKQSLVNAERWLKLYNDNKVSDGYSILVGNKIDLSYRVVTPQEGKSMADFLKIDYFEISAKTGLHVEELFLHIIDQLIEGRTNGYGNVLDPIRDEIKEEKDEEIIDSREPVRSTRKSRREDFSHPVDQTNSTLTGSAANGYIHYKGPNLSQPQNAQYYTGGLPPQQSTPAVVVYTQGNLGQPQPAAANIVLSSAQPPPLNDQTKKKCCS